MVNPRLVFDGHTHFSCFNEAHGVPEYTIPSFSWRNIKTPSMILLQVDDKNHSVNKCFLPSEVNVINIYMFFGVLALVYATITFYQKFLRNFLLSTNILKRIKIY